MKMNIRLNLVLIGDENYGGFTAYFEEFPNVIAEGDNEEEAEFKLINLLKVALEYRTTKIVRADGQKQKGIRKELNFELEHA